MVVPFEIQLAELIEIGFNILSRYSSSALCLAGAFFCDHTFLNSVKQVLRNDSRDTTRLNNITVFIFTDIFTVVQHTGNTVYADFTATLGANTFYV